MVTTVAIPGFTWNAERDTLAGLNFIGFLLCTIPLVWQMKAWNVGCVLFGMWCSLTCLMYFINLVVWKETMQNFAPAWCEIALRILWMSDIGVPCAGLVIARRLCKITSGTVITTPHGDKRRELMIELAIGLVPALLQIPIYWVVQGHRFDIWEDYGCQWAIPPTWLKFGLHVVWQVPIGLISAQYCIRTLISFFKRRREFNALLGSNSHLSFNLYLRLVIMCVAETVVTIPLGIYNIYSHITGWQYPYKDFAELHVNFNRVMPYTRVVWIGSGLKPAIERSVGTAVATAFFYFLVFGFGQDAKRHYSNAYTTVVKKLGISDYTLGGSTSLKTSKFAKSVSLPSFVNRNPNKVETLGTIDITASRFSVPLSALSSIGGSEDPEKLDVSPYSETSSACDVSSAADEKGQLHEETEPTQPPRPDGDVV